MDRGINTLFLPYTYTPSSSPVGLIPHLRCYQRCEPMTFNMWAKIKFVLWQPPYSNLLAEKKEKNIHVFKVPFFRKKAVTINLNKFSSNTSFRWYTFEKFYNVKFRYFSGRPNKTKKMFWNIFNWPPCWWYWK